jgi:hypothetical protein
MLHYTFSATPGRAGIFVARPVFRKPITSKLIAVLATLVPVAPDRKNATPYGELGIVYLNNYSVT